MRVEFYWGMGSTKSQWIRMIQPHTGGGKGFYFIPEIDEEVLVGFEGGNAQAPYVMGAHYNGQELSGYNTPKNDIKAIHTRSGHIIKFTEDESIIITDKIGNEIHLDTVGGNINITAPKVITMTATDIIMNASQNITSSAGMNISESAGVDKSTTIGMMHNISVGGDSMLNVTGNFFENIDGNFNSEIKNDKTYNVVGKVVTQSEKGHEFHSDKTIKNNSAEDTRQN